MRDNPWITLFAIAARQFGVVTRWQAVSVGINTTTFTRRVRDERWQQPYRGVFLVPGATWEPLTRLSAALLAVGPHAAAASMTSLYLHGVVDRVPAHPILVIPHGRRAPRLAGVRVLRSRTLQADDLTKVRGLPCTVPARAFMDVAPQTTTRDLRILLIDARQLGLVSPEAVIERAMMATSRVPGRGALLAAAIDVSTVGADSVLSDAVHRRLIDAGLVPDDDPVAVDIGRRFLHPDITFARHRVCIECDSLAHHGDQRAIDLDHRKDQAYSRARWKCLRVGWRRLAHDWSGFVAAVRHALDEWPRVCAALDR